MQILLVEDDQSLASGLCKALTREGFAVNHVATGAAATHVLATDPPDIVVLDLGLPDWAARCGIPRDSCRKIPLPVSSCTP